MRNKETKNITVSELENELTNALNRLADGDIKRHKQSQKRKAEMDLTMRFWVQRNVSECTELYYMIQPSV